MPEKRPQGAPPGSANRLKHGIFADRILNGEEKVIFDTLIDQLCQDFVFNRSSDFIEVELIGVYSVKLMRAQIAGDNDAAEQLDRMIRAHMRNLKTTKLSREGEEPPAPKEPKTSPAEWAAALLDKVSSKRSANVTYDNLKNTKLISDNTDEAEYEEAE